MTLAEIKAFGTFSVVGSLDFLCPDILRNVQGVHFEPTLRGGFRWMRTLPLFNKYFNFQIYGRLKYFQKFVILFQTNQIK